MREQIAGGALTETTFLVLLATYTPSHGYGIMQWIERETAGRVLLGAGTLYGALQTLMRKKWITPTGNDAPGSSKKEYVITALGRQVAERELRRVGELYALASEIMGEERT